MPKLAYHPPAGDTYVPGHQCFLVFVPDDPAYTRAFWGAYTDLAFKWLWDERDLSRLDGIEQSWLSAVIASLECLEMGMCEQIIERLSAIENAIYLTSCCGVGSLPDAVRTSDIVPGVGDPPALWGNEPVADWDDYEDLLCGAAHAYVDLLKSMAVDAQRAISGGALLIGGVALILMMLSGAGIIWAVGYAAAAGAMGGLLLLVGSGAFDALDEDIEAARADITCAIVSGGDLASAVAQAVGMTAWDSLFRWVNYDSAMATMLNGGAGGESLSVDRTQTCPCVTPDYYVWARDGVDLGGGLWQSEVSGGNSRIRLYVYTDETMVTPYPVEFTLSNDSAYGTRILSGIAYRVYDTPDFTLVYSSATEYPVSVEGYVVTIAHSGSTPFTVQVDFTEVP